MSDSFFDGHIANGFNVFDTEKEMIKAKNFIIQSNVTHSYIRVKDLKT